jgi:hypothetical protein
MLHNNFHVVNLCDLEFVVVYFMEPMFHMLILNHYVSLLFLMNINKYHTIPLEEICPLIKYAQR